MLAGRQKPSILNFFVVIVLLGGLLGMKAVEQVRAATTIVVENVNDSGEAGANAPQLIVETTP